MRYVGKNEYGFSLYIDEKVEGSSMPHEQLAELEKKYAEQVCERWEDVNDLGKAWVDKILSDRNCGMPSWRNDSAVDLLIAMQLATYPEQLNWLDVLAMLKIWQDNKSATNAEMQRFQEHLSRVFDYIDVWAFRDYYANPRNIERSVNEEIKTEVYKVTFDSYWEVFTRHAKAPDPIGLMAYAIGNIGGAGCPSVQAIGGCLSDDDAGRITLNRVKRAFADEQERKEASKTTLDIMKKASAAEQREKENR